MERVVVRVGRFHLFLPVESVFQDEHGRGGSELSCEHGFFDVVFEDVHHPVVNAFPVVHNVSVLVFTVKRVLATLALLIHFIVQVVLGKPAVDAKPGQRLRMLCGFTRLRVRATDLRVSPFEIGDCLVAELLRSELTRTPSSVFLTVLLSRLNNRFSVLH